MMKTVTDKPALSRRGFLRTGGAAAAAAFVPAPVLGLQGQNPPSNRLNIACIGLGWPGCKDTDALAGDNNIVALCDVDANRAPDFRKKYPDAKPFQDYRRMWDSLEKGIDAVIVATPDHTHAVLAMAAIRRGKHVYCEKPLAHSIHEVRELVKAAQAHKVVTQMGNQGHSSNETRMFCEWIWDGAIGQVHTIHARSQSVNSGLDRLAEARKGAPAPANLNWDLWLGPAQQRPYSPAYLHESWRGWVPFGNGTIGDWMCHVLGPSFWALDLGAPKTAVAEVKDYDPQVRADVYPKSDTVTFEFPARDKRGPVTLKWHSGAVPLPRPQDLEPERKVVDTGAIVYGDKGAIMHGSHGAGGLRLFPEEKMKAYKRPPPSLPRVPRGGHEQDWARAIREGRKACSDFSQGGPMTEIALVGVIALRMAGTKLEWDAAKAQFTNGPEANPFVNPPYRDGWTL
jgi:predicted dehydrogenase